MLTRFDVARSALLRMSSTPTNYWLGPIVDASLGAACLGLGLRRGVPAPYIALLILAGLVLFSFMEYAFHRWVFHGPAKIIALGHAAHHRTPRGYESVPFFVPALVLACLIAVCAIWMPVAFASILASGATLGYVAYGIAHFMVHRGLSRYPAMRPWAAHHHIHHRFPITTSGLPALCGTSFSEPDSPLRRQGPRGEDARTTWRADPRSAARLGSPPGTPPSGTSKPAGIRRSSSMWGTEACPSCKARIRKLVDESHQLFLSIC